MTTKTELMKKYETADAEYQSRINKIHDTDIWIGRSRYQIRVLAVYGQCTVCLDPYGTGDVAESGTDRSSYEYTHGGKLYCLACDIADNFDQYLSGNDTWLDSAEKHAKKYAKKYGV